MPRKATPRKYRLSVQDAHNPAQYHTLVEETATLGEARRMAKNLRSNTRIEVQKPNGKWQVLS